MNLERNTQSTKASQANDLLASGALQRKCACGQHTPGGGKCAECNKKKLNQPLQTKLRIGEANDRYEQEADRVAAYVMTASAYSVIGDAPPRIQRFTGQSKEQMNAGPASVERVLASPGRPLEPASRQDMEQRFGYDFSRVRVHSGTAAEQSARDMNAHAYTVGHDIVFGAGRLELGTQVGRRVLAHELVHVVQQSGSEGNRLAQSDEKRGLSPVSHLVQQGKSTETPFVQGFWAELGGALLGAVGGIAAFASGGLAGIIAGGLLGGLFGGFAAHFLSKLFGGGIDRTEPNDEGIDRTDPTFWETWEHYLLEGSSLLKSGGCRFPSGNGPWKYDDRYWERIADPDFVAYKPKGVSPAKALDELFNNPSLWELDCALHPETLLFYAYRRTLGAAKFNEEFKDMIIRQHSSQGLQTEFYDVDNESENAFNTLWNDAPVGSKVMWTNRSPATIGTDWHNENGIKRKKGATWEEDKYDAHPLGTNLLEKDVKKEFAEFAADYPDIGSVSEKEHYVDGNIYRHQLHLINRS